MARVVDRAYRDKNKNAIRVAPPDGVVMHKLYQAFFAAGLAAGLPK